jgi:dihydroneopterin aldolase
VTTSRVFVSGIRASGRHGANSGEKDAPQEFVVDLDVQISVAGDDIAETADYRRLAAIARETVERTSFDLLESLAYAVARAVGSADHVEEATAVVHKPNAARSIGVDGVAAAATAPGGGANGNGP